MKRNKDFEEWENSFEGVFYKLNIWQGTTVNDSNNKTIIVKTLLKLPKKIREKVLDEVTFIILGIAGTVMNLRFTKLIKDTKEKKKLGSNTRLIFEQPSIFLNFSEVKRGQEEDTVAHEIAHIILNHHKMDKSSNKKNEREADNLTEKWGFKRAYKSYKQFENG